MPRSSTVLRPVAAPRVRGAPWRIAWSVGALLAVCTVLPSRHATAQASAAPSAFAVHKAETLLREQLPCLGCHAFGSEGGRLAPDLRTVRQRRSVAYIAAMIDAPQQQAPGSLMPRTAMLPATREAIVRYLQSLPGDGNAPPPTAGAAAAVAASTDGAALYATWCAGCHGARGKGDGPNARYLPVPPAKHADASAMSLRSDDALYDTIAGGGAIMNRSPRMPAFGETLADPQIRALVSYIRTLCSCKGPAWSRE